MPRKPSFLRLVGRLEALSFVILLGIAMPLKYLAGRPEFVQWAGWAHGVLFIGYYGLIATSWRNNHWPMARPALLAVAALVPCGPYLIESRLAKWESGN